MKKVRITESQLRGLVKKMIKENVESDLKSKGFTDNEIKNIASNPKALDVANKSLHLNKDQLKTTLEPHLKGIPMGMTTKGISMSTTSIDESELRGLVKRMIREEMDVSYSAIMKGVRNGSAPFTIVALERDFNARNGFKVLGQSITRIPDAVPAHYEGMIKDYPNLTNIVIEDSTGQIVFKDKIN